MVRRDTATATNDIGADFRPVAGKMQIAFRRDIGAQLMDVCVCTGIFVIHQWKGVGIDADHRRCGTMLAGKGIEFGTTGLDRISHHFRLAAIEQQRVKAHALYRQQKFGQRLARP